MLGEVPGMGFPRERRYSDETAHLIDQAVQKIVDHAFQRTIALLTQRRETLEGGARRLLEKETLGPEDLRELAAAARAIAAE
jgi:cell division protease FtsH